MTSPSTAPTWCAPIDGTHRCWDNAAAETFFATLKNEMHCRHDFRIKARARFALAEFIEAFYNRKRMHSASDYRTPAQALNDYRSAALAA